MEQQPEIIIIEIYIQNWNLVRDAELEIISQESSEYMVRINNFYFTIETYNGKYISKNLFFLLALLLELEWHICNIIKSVTIISIVQVTLVVLADSPD